MHQKGKIGTIALSAALFASSLLSSPQAFADGDEYLGDVTIGNSGNVEIKSAIESGNKIRIAGTGLHSLPDNPGTIQIELNEGEVTERVIMYWQVFDVDANFDTQVSVTREEDGSIFEVFGEVIGRYVDSTGPDEQRAFYSSYSATVRADITDLGIIKEGTNTLSVSDLDAEIAWGDNGRNGAGIMLIFSDGSGSKLQLADGHDAVWWKGEDVNLRVSEPVRFDFDASDSARTADLSMFVASVEGTVQSGQSRDSVVEIRIGDNPDNTIRDVNVLTSAAGDEWDNYVRQVPIPAGVSHIEVQIYSETDPFVEPDPDNGINPASLVWVAAGISVSSDNQDVCNCRPTALTFKFVGGSCDATTNDQNGKLQCYGDLGQAQDIDVYAFSSNSWRSRLQVENDWLVQGDTFTISRRHDKQLPKKTKLMLKSGHDKLILKLRTSCKQPLAIGDRFGPLELVGFEAPEDCGTHTKSCRDKYNHSYHHKWKKSNHSGWFKGWKRHGG